MTVILGFGVPCEHKETYLRQLASNKRALYRSLCTHVQRQAGWKQDRKLAIYKANRSLQFAVLNLVRDGLDVVVDLTLSKLGDRRRFIQELDEAGAERIHAVFFTTWCLIPPTDGEFYGQLLGSDLREVVYKSLTKSPPTGREGFTLVQRVQLAH